MSSSLRLPAIFVRHTGREQGLLVQKWGERAVYRRLMSNQHSNRDMVSTIAITGAELENTFFHQSQQHDEHERHSLKLCHILVTGEINILTAV